jgi:hypothetical protein
LHQGLLEHDGLADILEWLDEMEALGLPAPTIEEAKRLLTLAA